MARRSTRKGFGGGAAIGGIGLLTLAVVAAIGLGLFYFLVPRDPALNPETLCPVDGPHGITVILVDTSDDIKPTTRQDAQQFLQDQIAALPAFHRLELRVLDFANLRSRIVFSKCNPGDGTGLSEWTGNPRIARLRWLELFKKPVEEAIKASLASGKATSSPIMGAIQDIALGQFSPASVRNIPKRLVLVSDMIEFTQGTGGYNQYPPRDLTYQRFRRSPAYTRFRTDLHGAGVNIQYVPREAVKIDRDRHLEFWGEWIDDNRGKRDGVRVLQGAN